VTSVRYVDLDGAAPDEAVVVVDVLRAFTVVPWLFARGVERVLTVAGEDEAIALRDDHLPGALLAGESGGRPLPGFDLGNSPTEVRDHPDLTGATVIHRTSAGTQGLARTTGSPLVLAASFVTAAATARHLRAAAPSRVTFVVTGDSLGRDGDEDLAAAELIAARLAGEDPDPAAYVARIAGSDAGRHFSDDGPDWAPVSDRELAEELDRFDRAIVARPARDLGSAIALSVA
jgi:2-phosphosulfolactate phosphatase